MAQLVVGAVGAYVGFLVGGPAGAQAGWALGSTVGGMLAAPDQQGPRLAERTVQLSSYGSPVAKVYGSGRLAGTLIWSTDLIESEHTESAKGGPETTTYSYSVSCAVAVCEGAIGSIRRIWADAKLVYDISDGASGETQAASSAFAEFMTVYTGTEAQLPDATIEAIEGAGNVEAYRGTAYVVFAGLPVGDYGNRIPNFMFEVTNEAPVVDSDELLAPLVLGPWGGNPPSHSLGRTEFQVMDDPSGDVFDSLAEAAERLASLYPSYTTYIGYYNSLRETGPLEGFMDIFGGAGDTNSGGEGNGAGFCYLVYNIATPDVIAVSYSGIGGGVSWNGAAFPEMYRAGFSYLAPRNPDGRIYLTSTGSAFETGVSALTIGYCAAMPPTGFSVFEADLHQYYTVNPEFWLATPDPGSPYPQIAVSQHRIIRAFRKPAVPPQSCEIGDPEDLGVAQLPGNADYCISSNGAISKKISYAYVAGAFVQLQKILGVNIYGYYDTVPLGPIKLASDPDATNAAFWNAAALLAGVPGSYPSFPVSVTEAATGSTIENSVAAGSTSLSTIVSDLCVEAGLSTSQIDVTELTDEVLGFTRGRVMSARSAIESLRSAFYFDAVESGSKIRFVKRGAAPVASLTLDDIGAGQDAATEPLEHDRAQEAELPSAVAVAYQSQAIDFQTGVQQARRRVGGSQQINQVELPMVLTDEKAAEVADVLLYDSWASRTRRTFRTGVAFAHLEPTDIVEVDDGAATYELRIVDKVEDGGVITFDCRDNDVASYSPDSVAAPPSGGGSTVRFDGPSKLFLLDMPILRDADDDPGYYLAGTGYLSSWRGASAFRSANDGATYTAVRDLVSRVVSGQADTVLGNYSGGNTVDEINSVDVTLLFGELSSITRAQLLNSGNGALLGDELIQFQRAVLQSGNTYRLTGLLRGRNGTERHMATHAANERFVLISASTLYRVSAPLSEIDEASVWKGVTFGSTLADSYELDFTNTAVGLMPLAPVHLSVAPVAGEYLAQWVRRTRYDATWRPLVDAPLGETVEAYEVDVFNAAGALVSTISTTTTSATFGSPEKGLMYAVGLIWPGEYGGSLYAAEYTFGGSPQRFLRMAADGSIAAATSAFAGHVWRVVYDGTGAAYLITTETDVSDTYVAANVIYRVDLASMAITASIDLYTAVSQVGYEIVHDGTDLWSVTTTGATLRKHNTTTLAITATHVLTNTATRTLNLAHNGAGTFYVGCKDWTHIIAYTPGTTTTVWDIDFAASAGAIESIWFVNGMLFVTGTLNTVAIAPATGAVVATHSEISAGVIVDYGGNAAYAELIATAIVGGVVYSLGDVRVLETTGGTFVDSQPIDGDSLALVGTVDGDLLVTAYRPSGPGGPVAYQYGAPADLTGGSVTVYQISSVIGRGYPASTTL